MDAILLSEFGGPEVLRSEKVETPSCGADQILVRVAACGVCGHDILNRAGHFPGTRLPAVIGHEIAGTVEEVGTLIRGFRSGERVALLQRQSCGRCRSCLEGRENLCRAGDGFYGEGIVGGYGEVVVASERNCARLPDEISFEMGAVLSCAIGTGFHALLRARVRPGDCVVITGASGGVGIHTLQTARMMGLRAIAIASSDAKIIALRAAGADEVIVAPDHRFHERVRQESDGEGAAAVIEITGASTFDSSIRSLRPGGRLVLVGNVSPGNVALNPAVSILKEIEVIGSAHAVLGDLTRVIDLVRRKRLTPIIAHTVPWTEAAAAHRIVESRSAVGRVVLTHG
jgi:D-arabinose 1-dehydrogenase-like Zn-dependent alcohol dehydrogenase